MSDNNTAANTENELLYTKYLSQMDEEQVATLWNACHEAGLVPDILDSEEPDAEKLAEHLQDVAHVDVVVACGDTLDSKILEILMSQPLTRNYPEPTARPDKQAGPHIRPNGSRSHGPKKEKVTYEPGTKGPAPSPDDPRILSHVAANPKKPSSAAFQRYALYTVGQSIAEFIKAGGTKADVQYDLGKGFIKVVTPEEWAAQKTES